MARETKAERLAREEAARAAQLAQAQAEYPQRVMQALRQATELGMRLTVTESLRFKVSHRGEDWVLPAEYSEWNELDDLESEMASLLRVRAEEERRANLRLNALNKLSLEEQEVLGLVRAAGR